MSNFKIQNIKYGSEKIASDDFAMLLKKRTGINLNNGLAKDAVAIGKSVKGTARTFINSEFREISQAVTRSMSNGEDSKTLQNFIGVSGLAYAMLSNTASASVGKQKMGKLRNVENSVFGSDNMKELNKVLRSSHAVEFDVKLGKTPSYNDIKRLERKLNVFARQKYGQDFSKMSKDKLIKELGKARKAGDEATARVLETAIGMKEVTGGKKPISRRPSKITGRLQRLLNMNVDNETLRGWNQVMKYNRATMTIAKTTLFYYKLQGKALLAVANVATNGVIAGMSAMGFKSQAQTLSNAKQAVQNTAKSITNAASSFKTNLVNSAKDAIETTPGKIGRKTLDTGKKVVGRTGKAISNTKVYHGAARVVTRVGNSAPAQAMKTAGRATMRVGRKVLGSKPARFAGKVLSLPLKFAGGVKSVFFKIVSGVNFLIKQAAVAIGGLVAGYLIVVVCFMVIISSISVIGDAVTAKIGEMKEDASMTAAYNKLRLKESQFASEIAIAAEKFEVPQELTDQYGITEFTDSQIVYIDGNGQPTTNTSTIKQILSMAAVYIDQDFNKYGAMFDKTLTDSVYKDYCAKLYDSSHIIGISTSEVTSANIYYCGTAVPDTDDDDVVVDGEDDFTEVKTNKPAMPNCNNKSEGVKYVDILSKNGYTSNHQWQDDWKKMEDEYKKQCSTLCVKKEHEEDDDWVLNDYYTIEQLGPHKKSTEVTDKEDDTSQEKLEKAEKSLKDKGCTNPVRVVTGIYTHKTDESEEYYNKITYVCGCPTCNGHVDAPIYVYIGNAYDPSSEVGTVEATDEATGTDGTASGTTGTVKKKDAHDNIDKEGAETKYSLYAVDKYATAFDDPNASFSVFCTNPDCTMCQNQLAVSITEDDPTCPECGTTLTLPGGATTKIGRAGDEESVEKANEKTDKHAAEEDIMKSITGKDDVKLHEWWKNDGWFESLSTTKTYFRLHDETDKTIDELEKPKSGTDRNVVNATNSEPYWFECFTEDPTKRNNDFAKFGWDDGGIARVRFLLANDWMECYGIQDFGGFTGSMGAGISGTGVSDAEIAQMIANNKSWADLSDDRKALMATCLEFYNQIKRLGVNYHGATCKVSSLEELKKCTSKSQAFTIEYPNNICTSEKRAKYNCNTDPGIDCSGFVSWIAYAASGGQFPRKVSTSEMVNSYVGTKLIPIESFSLIQPGDIALKKGHVLMYIGNGQWAEAAGHGPGIRYGVTKSASYLNAYNFYRFSFVDDTKHTVDYTEDTDTEEAGSTVDPTIGFGSE